MARREDIVKNDVKELKKALAKGDELTALINNQTKDKSKFHYGFRWLVTKGDMQKVLRRYHLKFDQFVKAKPEEKSQPKPEIPELPTRKEINIRHRFFNNYRDRILLPRFDVLEESPQENYDAFSKIDYDKFEIPLEQFKDPWKIWNRRKQFLVSETEELKQVRLLRKYKEWKMKMFCLSEDNKLPPDEFKNFTRIVLYDKQEDWDIDETDFLQAQGDINNKNNITIQNAEEYSFNRRQTEFNSYKGDETFDFQVEIQFAHDTCEFRTYGKTLLRKKRKWRREPTKFRTITWREIKTHKYPNDCWTVIKDRVYDLTEFLSHHPGGEIPLQQVYGKDGTWVFSGVHPYVVYYDGLKGDEVGRAPEYKEGGWPWTKYEPIHQFDGLNVLCHCLCSGKHPLRDYFPVSEFFRSSATQIIYTIEFPSTVIVNSSAERWCFAVVDQKDVIIRFYVTKDYMWYGIFRLPIALEDDVPYWEFDNDFHKVTLTFERPYLANDCIDLIRKRPELLRDHGTILHSYSLSEWYPAWFIQIAFLSEDRCLFVIGIEENAFFGVPIGFYVDFLIDGIERPYTPICFPIIEDPKKPVKKTRDAGSFGALHFLIRIQKDGMMGCMLDQITKMDLLGKQDLSYLKISPPRGRYETSWQFGMDVMLLIAGGTGISTFTRIIKHYLDRENLIEGKCIILMYHNRKDENMVFGKTWKWIANHHEWFHYFPITTLGLKDSEIQVDAQQPHKRLAFRPSKNAGAITKFPIHYKNEIKGHASLKNIRKVLKKVKGANDPEKKLKIMLSGPSEFMHWTEIELKDAIRENKPLTDMSNVFFFPG